MKLKYKGKSGIEKLIMPKTLLKKIHKNELWLAFPFYYNPIFILKLIDKPFKHLGGVH